METRTEGLIRSWLQEQVAQVPLGVSPRAERFLEDVLVEAFDLRRSEEFAQFRLGLRPEGVAQHEQVANALQAEVGLTVRELLAEAYNSAMAQGANEVLVIDLLEVINRRWCGVWPFCRAST